MKERCQKFYQNNKSIVWAAIIAIIITIGILLKVKDEVTRFTLIMPVFAGFILFSILMTSDEDFEETEEKEEKPKEKKGTKSSKKSPKK